MGLPNYTGYPGNNFLRYFCTGRLPGFENILENNEINYTRLAIVQASQVKEEREELNDKSNEVKIISIYAVAMYPSIKFPLVKKAILFFTRNSPNNSQLTIKLYLKPIALVMRSTLLKFGGEYFE